MLSGVVGVDVVLAVELVASNANNFMIRTKSILFHGLALTCVIFLMIIFCFILP